MFERLLALGMLVLAAPLIALIALAIRSGSGAPIFYHGTRLGRHRRPFRMLKLRTLVVGAEQVTGGELLNHRHQLTIRGGRFLRDTRLDELPQLWNIVRGEMSFVGPRPERPEVYVTKCRDIPGYERRFDVRPGLIGISQLFTPHSTPKRYRTLLDNGGIRHEQGLVFRLGIVLLTMWSVAREVARRCADRFVLPFTRRRGTYREKRLLRRVSPPGAFVHLRTRDARENTMRVLDMNEEVLRIEGELQPGSEPEAELLLDIPVRGLTRPARRSARCTGSLVQREGARRSELLIQYRPCSQRSEYVVHQYFLRGSLVAPRREWRGTRPPLDCLALEPAVEASAPEAMPALEPTLPAHSPEHQRHAAVTNG